MYIEFRGERIEMCAQPNVTEKEQKQNGCTSNDKMIKSQQIKAK